MVRDGCCHPGASAAKPVLPVPTPPRLLSRPGPECLGCARRKCRGGRRHPQPSRALVVLAGAVTARGQTPTALTRRSCQPQTLSNRARERALQLQPPSDRHPGRHGPQGKYFLKVTSGFGGITCHRGITNFFFFLFFFFFKKSIEPPLEEQPSERREKKCHPPLCLSLSRPA